MSALSTPLIHQLGRALTDRALGEEAATALQAAKGCSHQIMGAIVATNVSQTVDFGAVRVGDLVAMIPAVAGNADFITIATNGDLGQAAVVGNLYLVLRAVPAAVSIKW